ncbi:MAG TPA: M50 family metallopeptidase [Candidatus Saccharimonadales bacterium]
MQLLFGIILGLLVLVVLVVAHELGHAIVARRNGVVVEEFGVGFPPRAWGKKLKNGVLFTLNWLPLGGFVKLQGEHDAANKKGDYGAAGYWGKTKILLAGVAMNWLIAAVLLTALAWVGLPKILPNQFTMPGDTTVVKKPVEIVEVIKDSPAAAAGLSVGDEILRFNGETVPTADTLVSQAEKHKGQTVEVIYSRSGVEHTTDVKLRGSDGDSKGYLGVGSGQQQAIRASWSAPIVGVTTAAQFTWVTLEGLGQLVGNLVSGVILQFSSDSATRTAAHQALASAGSSVAGPVGILGTIFPAAEQAGFSQVVFLTAIISLTLAVMNILPIPALDGGRWFVMTIYRLRGKELTKEREEKIQGTGFLVLMILVIIVTVADVSKLFR